MSAPFVLDNSVVMRWLMGDIGDGYAFEVMGRLEDRPAVAPSIWPLELANAVAVAERRRLLTRAKADAFLRLVAALPITVVVDPPGRALGGVLELARMHALSSYDATYLDLALREGLPIATLDGGLRRAVEACSVELLG